MKSGESEGRSQIWLRPFFVQHAIFGPYVESHYVRDTRVPKMGFAETESSFGSKRAQFILEFSFFPFIFDGSVSDNGP